MDNGAPYRDPLGAVVTINHEAATLALNRRASAWVGPDPWARGALEKDYPHAIRRPAISDWSGPFWATKVLSPVALLPRQFS